MPLRLLKLDCLFACFSILCILGGLFLNGAAAATPNEGELLAVFGGACYDCFCDDQACVGDSGCFDGNYINYTGVYSCGGSTTDFGCESVSLINYQSCIESAYPCSLDCEDCINAIVIDVPTDCLCEGACFED